MATEPETRHRRSIRLKGYDYSRAGAYFITVCAQHRKCQFGTIVNGKMRLNGAGEMIQIVWKEIPVFYSGIEIDEFVVMPNHIHGIIIIVGAGPRACPGLSGPRACPGLSGPRACPGAMNPDGEGHPRGGAPTLSLPDVVHRFKTMTTKRYADGVKKDGWVPFPGKLWQRNYWERVIRNDAELNGIREYIHNNPAGWALDQLNDQGSPAPNPPPEAWMV